jgi:hypothetical protein
MCLAPFAHTCAETFFESGLGIVDVTESTLPDQLLERIAGFFD